MRPSVEDILENAARGAGDHAGALAWVDGPLRRHLSAGAGLPEVPDALRRSLSLDGAPSPWHWVQLAPCLAEAVAARGPWPPRRTLAITVAAAVAHADLLARQEANRARPSPADLAVARRGPALVRWTDGGHGTVLARFHLGRFGFACCFQDRGRTWERHWLPDPDTARSLRAIQARYFGAEGRPTGLFPAIDAALRAITREFLDRYNPAALTVHGANAKRNGHNAATYGSVMAEEYGLVPLRAPGDPRATPDGTVGVRFERLPEAAPAMPMPLEPGVLYGDGGRPLPDLREARACAEAGRRDAPAMASFR